VAILSNESISRSIRATRSILNRLREMLAADVRVTRLGERRMISLPQSHAAHHFARR
jgi:hypothetical protein